MPLSPPASQAPAERRALESQVRASLARLAPGHERLVGALRRALRQRLPTAYELVYEYASWLVISYAPSERGYEGVVAIRGSAEGVALYLTGKGLPDPEKLLQGSGKLARFIPVASASTLRRPAVVRLIDAALAKNRVSFPRSGPGPVIFRSAATSKPPRRRTT